MSFSVQRQEGEKQRDLQEEVEEYRDRWCVRELLNGRHLRQRSEEEHGGLGQRADEHGGTDFAEHATDLVLDRLALLASVSLWGILLLSEW